MQKCMEKGEICRFPCLVDAGKVPDTRGTIVLPALTRTAPMTTPSLYANDPARGWLPWGALVPFLLVLFVALPVVVTDSWFERMLWVDARGTPLNREGLFAFLLIPFAMTGALAWAWVRAVERRSLASIGLTARGLRPWLAGLALGAATIAGVVLAIWLAGGYRASGFAPALASPAALRDVGLLLLCFMLQAGVEEFVFRGWMMSVLARKWNRAAAVIVVTLVFTLLHYGPGQQWPTMLGTILFSVFACAWALSAGNIWGVMGWHTGWNWLLSIGFELPVTGLETHLPALLVKLVPQGSDALTGGAVGPEDSYLCKLFFVLGIAFIAWRHRRHTQRCVEPSQGVIRPEIAASGP